MYVRTVYSRLDACTLGVDSTKAEGNQDQVLYAIASKSALASALRHPNIQILKLVFVAALYSTILTFMTLQGQQNALQKSRPVYFGQ